MKHNEDQPSIRWQRKSRELVYENPWIKVHHDNVITPTGTDGIYGVVEFKSHAVGILPIDNEGYTWLVRQSRYPHNCYTWEMPEGGAPLDEPLLDAAKRELKEETGLSAAQWHVWLEMQLSNSVTNECATIFIAEDLTPGEMALESTEDIEVKRLPLHTVFTMLKNGEIVDSMTVAALYKLLTEERFRDWIANSK